MPIVPFTDIISLTVILGLMIWLNTVAYVKKAGTYNVMAGVLGLYSIGNLFFNGALIYQGIWNGASFVNQSVDANLFVVILAVMTLASFLPIYLERYQ